jgi:oligopeptide transport system permease protein
MKMLKYVLKRIGLAIVSLFIICAITFFAMNAIPGGPFNGEKAKTEAVLEVLNARYNLDKPVPVQFYYYMRNLLHGDMGVSLTTGRDIKTTIFESFGISAKLG